MIKFRTRIQAELYLKWINFWIPIKLKWEGQHLLANRSFISKNFLSCGTYDNDNRWSVVKQFGTQEMIDDLKNFKSIDPSELETEHLTNYDRKKKLDYMLNDKPIEPEPETELAKQIRDNILKNIQNVRKQES